MIEIRGATLEDVPDIARVHAKADWETYAPLFGAQAYALEVAECERRWRQVSREEGVLLVATDGGRIIGPGARIRRSHRRPLSAGCLSPAEDRQGPARTAAPGPAGAGHSRGGSTLSPSMLRGTRRPSGGSVHEQGPTGRHRGLDFCHCHSQGWRLRIGPVAQLDRVPRFERGGCGFKPCRDRQFLARRLAAGAGVQSRSPHQAERDRSLTERSYVRVTPRE